MTDPTRTKLIAKRVHKHSNELAILQYLRTIRPRSPHIISLIETVKTNDGKWLILTLFLVARHDRLSYRFVQYSCDLIKGLAYLHKHGVAHLDIKTNNLVYPDHGPLQII
jgi:serine/threonine protein kinase